MKKIKITKEQFDKITNLLKEGFPKLKKNIVDNTFKRGFAGKEIKNLGELRAAYNNAINDARNSEFTKAIAVIKDLKGTDTKVFSEQGFFTYAAEKFRNLSSNEIRKL